MIENKTMKREMSFAEVQVCAFEILKYVKYICKKYNIYYFLSFGTALGAVRHNGFIPWDDDIDVCIFRRDYQSFISAFRQENSDRYKLLSTDTDEKYSLPQIKIVDTKTILFQDGRYNDFEMGVWVDVFALDNVPDDSVQREKYFRKLKRYQYYWGITEYIPVKGNDIKSHLKYYAKKVYKLFLGNESRKWAVKLEHLSLKYERTITKDVGVISFFPYDRNRGVSPRIIVENSVDFTFENDTFPIPKEYDSYLRKIYGNYMELPPEEQRKPHHSYMVYHR